MKILKLPLFTILCAFTSLVKAQITTTNNLTPQQLVQQVLLGQGVTASNITYSGDQLQISRFNATTSTSLGINSGILLSTGNANSSSASGPQGPNNMGGTSTGFGGNGDNDLDNISSASTEDAAILEFDFVPTSDSIKFRYCFGSEEYPEFVGSFNDVFAYFLTGPNPLGGNYNNVNIALIPGTSTPVTINNVNASSNSFYYRSNTGNVINCEFDGITKVMYAMAKVVCGQTYHIKIAIADAGDDAYDSGVFLEEGSFSSAPPLNVFTTNSNSNIPDSILVEDCNTYCAYFIRNGNVAVKDSFSLQVSGNAILGVDYVQTGNPSFTWPTKLIFEPNQDTIKICGLVALQDNIVEGADTLKFTMSSFITSSVSCIATNAIKFNLYVLDYDSISIGQNDLTLCSGSSAILNAAASFGYPQYTYTVLPAAVNTATYNTGPITSTSSYTIIVNDVCNHPVSKTITITPVPIPTVTANSATVCSGQNAVLVANGADTYLWSTNVANDTLVVNTTITTNYTVVGAVGTCTSMAVSTVSVMGQNLAITGNTIICDGSGTILTANNGGSYTWNTGANTATISVTPSVTTEYTVTSILLTCTNTAVHTVSVAPIPVVTISGSIICSGQPAILIAGGASTYSWSTGTNGSFITVTPTTNTTYSVLGISAFNCSNTASYTQTVITTVPKITALPDYKFCIDSTTSISVGITEGSAPYFISWLIPSGGMIPNDTINQTYYFLEEETPHLGTYTITVTDQCSKKDTITINIETVDCTLIVPNVLTSNGDGVNDVFKINGLENFNNTVVYVYNRWGKKIFESTDYKNDWKPELNSGTYYYLISVSDGRKFNGFFQVFN